MLGIEMHLVEKARSDGKAIYGLETERQQMEILDSLSLDLQKEMLLQTLADGADMQEMLDNLIDAWRHGDTDRMAGEMLREMQEYPELLTALVRNRNNAWIAPIEELLAGDRNYLVAVGALHLVDDIGVPELLRKRGYTVTQLRTAH
jgi:uncharacterized protein YbaP (TraB family)